MKGEKQRCPAPHLGGLAGWLMQRWGKRQRGKPRLELLDRITLAPRQSLALVEAEGRRILVATSAEGAPAFFPLQNESAAEQRAHAGSHDSPRGTVRAARAS